MIQSWREARQASQKLWIVGPVTASRTVFLGCFAFGSICATEAKKMSRVFRKPYLTCQLVCCEYL